MSEIIAERFEVIRVLGSGSLGMVFLCRDLKSDGILCAVKVLFEEVSADSEAIKRLQNEFAAGALVNHPNVVRSHEFLRAGEIVALSTEYVDGGDLCGWITKGASTDFAKVIQLLVQVLEGLEAIHGAGILFRDLKPEKILLTSKGVPKLIDFGTVRNPSAPRTNAQGEPIMSIDYVAPEFLENGMVDPRSDIYSLGVLAFEVITGQLPFDGETVLLKVSNRLHKGAPSLRDLRPNCPVALEQVILKALARDPSSRYQSAREMLRELRVLTAVH